MPLLNEKFVNKVFKKAKQFELTDRWVEIRYIDGILYSVHQDDNYMEVLSETEVFNIAKQYMRGINKIQKEAN